MQNCEVKLEKGAGKISHPIGSHGAHSVFIGREERATVDLLRTRGDKLQLGKQEQVGLQEGRVKTTRAETGYAKLRSASDRNQKGGV